MGSVLVCEGQLDVIACHRAGLKNAVSAQGTAFTEEHARKLKRYADKVVLAFDADSAGRKAAFKSLEYLLPIGMPVSMLTWGQGQDPDSLYNSQGPQALKDCYDKAQNALEVLLGDLTATYDITTAEGKSKAAHIMIENIAKIPDNIIRSESCQLVSERLGIHIDSLFRELNRHYRNMRRKNSYKQDDQSIPASFQVTDEITPSIKAELILIELALQFEDIAMLLCDSLPSNYISTSLPGKALKDIIDMSLAGDWYSCKEHIGDKYLAHSAKIAEKLIKPEYTEDSKKDIIDRALKECLNTIKEAPLHERKNQIIALLRDPKQDATALKQEYQKIMKEIQELKS